MMARKMRRKAHNGRGGGKRFRRVPRASGRRGGCHLFDRWGRVARTLRAAERIALFLDFDGTLAPIRHRPEQVELAAATRRVLARLTRHPRLTLYVVSGRRVADVRRRVRVSGVRYIGLHGGEGENGRPQESEISRSVRRLRRAVEAKLAGLEGVWVEDKFISFAVHYRSAPGAAVRKARAVACELLVPVQRKFRVMEGKKVWEILPREVEGKGAAVRALVAELRAPVLPIYVGDDTTDESAFEALPRGVTVRVGVPRRTRARYELRNPDEVREFLERLEAEIATRLTPPAGRLAFPPTRAKSRPTAGPAPRRP